MADAAGIPMPLFGFAYEDDLHQRHRRPGRPHLPCKGGTIGAGRSAGCRWEVMAPSSLVSNILEMFASVNSHSGAIPACIADPKLLQGP